MNFKDKIKKINISGVEVFPIIEGGKGIGASNGYTAGAFAAAGAVGTVSGVNPQRFDKNNNIIPYKYNGKTRRERFEELVAQSIEGAVQQIKIAHKIANGKGRIHLNVLWEMGGAQRILEEVLRQSKGMVNGVTCGAGMPYHVAEIAEKYGVYYHPIVSSMRAFRALWKRSYYKYRDLLGSVVYEDPWLAGGHNGLSNAEDPLQKQNPFARVAQIRKFMNNVGLENTTIIMAGGVWHLKDWENWLDNPEIGKIAFQFGTRPLLTQETPILAEWKQRLITLKESEISLNKFSPTGFYSSAINNEFLQELKDRTDSEIPYSTEENEEFSGSLNFGKRGRKIYIKLSDSNKANDNINNGFSEMMKTPDNTVIFVRPKKAIAIAKDQANCMGCLSHCRFSNWKDHDDYKTGYRADPRSFCIQKGLQNAIAGIEMNEQLLFAGHNAYKFAEDKFYANGNIPTIAELVERILSGE